MKTTNTFCPAYRNILIIFAALCLAPLSTVRAATITWLGPQQITGDSDVSTAGTLVDAFNFVGADTTVNGVLFQQFNVGSTSNTVGNYNFSASVNIGTSDTSSTVAPFSSLSMSYQNLLGMAAERGDRLMTLTISGLMVGQTYAFQAWVNDSRDFNGNSFPVDVNGGEVTLSPGMGVDGSLGQFAIGYFTADATQQAFTFYGGEVGVVNGFQLREGVAVPAPETGATIVLFAIAFLSVLAAGYKTGAVQKAQLSPRC